MLPGVIAAAAVLIPAITGLLLTFTARIIKLERNAASASLAALTTSFILTLILAVIAYSAPLTIEYFSILLGSVTVKVGFYIDYIAVVFALVSLFIAIITQLYSLKYYSKDNKAYNITRYNRSIPLTLIFIGALITALLSLDLIILLFSLELLTITTYLFISYPGDKSENLKAGVKTLILTHISGLALLVFTLIMVKTTGTTQITALKSLLPFDSAFTVTGAALILCAAMPKTDQIPFHTWFPDSSVAPSPSIIIYHSCGFQIGVYLLIRFLFQVFRDQLALTPLIPLTSVFGEITAWSFTVILIGSLTLIIGAVYGMLGGNYKRIIAYTTVSETGLIIIAAGFQTPLALAACIYYTVSHALISTLLFLSYGSVEYTTGKTDVNQVGNLYQYMPLTAIGAIVSVIAIGGMPLLSEFIGKYLIINTALNAGSPFFIMTMFIGAALHIVIALRLVNAVFLSASFKPEAKIVFKDPPQIMTTPILIVTATIFALGVLPTLFLNTVVKNAIIQAGLSYTTLENIELILTGSGGLTYIVIAVSALSIAGMVAYIILVGGRRKKPRRKSLEAEKPFIGGEDVTAIKTVYTEQYYYYIIDLLKLEKTARVIDVDKLFDKIAKTLDKICIKALKLDVGAYLKALLMFLAGSLIITLIALII
jgi:NADH:ubiquinone oxidoreductase subunit 5 (subunit L)/multisubunit Na+/H+ antiporter MnhA subunit